LVAAAVTLACPLVSRAGTSLQWDPNPDDPIQGGVGSWDTSRTNWVNSAGQHVAWINNNGDTAVFGGDSGGLIGATNSVLSAGGIQFDTAGYTIGTTSSKTLTLTSGSVIANADAVLALPLSATGGLNKSGNATVTLQGANTVRTSVTLTAGLLAFGTEANLGTNTITLSFNGGGLRYAGANPLTLKNTRTLVVGAAGGTLDTATSVTLAATGQLTGAGTLTKDGAQTLSITADNANFTGAVAVNAGALQLASPASINHAAVTLAGGTLALRSDASSNMVGSLTATGNATLDVGPLTAGTTGPVHSIGDLAVTATGTLGLVTHDGHAIGAGAVSVDGTLRVNDATLSVGSSLSGAGTVVFGPRPAPVDGVPDGLIFGGGGARTASAGISADPNARATVGLTNATALTYAGAWSGNAAGASNSVTLAGGSSFVLSPAARLNTLAADGAPVRPFSVTGGGASDTFELADGFVADQPSPIYGNGGLASLDVRAATLVTHSTAALPLVARSDGAGGTLRAGSITFSGSAAAAWHAADADQQYAGGVTFAAPTTLRVDATLTHTGLATGRFDAQFQIPTADGLVTKVGPGSLRLSGSQGYAPGARIDVRDGILRFDTDPAAGWYTGNYTRGPDGAVTTPPAVAATLAVSVSTSDALAQFAAPLSRLKSLDVAPSGLARVAGDSPAGGETLVLNSLTVAPSGTLDLASGRLVLDYDAAAPSPLADVAAMVRDGRVAGGESLPGKRPTAVGFGEAADVLKSVPADSRTFGNAAVDATAVLARVTFVGDANLDGHVTVADYQRLELAFGKSGQYWSAGDFDGDGQVTSADFFLLYTNLDPATPPADQQQIDDFASTVPEPTGAAWVIGAAAAAALARRRRPSRR
jgi:autotransporter-associated beta strand protein